MGEGDPDSLGDGDPVSVGEGEPVGDSDAVSVGLGEVEPSGADQCTSTDGPVSEKVTTADPDGEQPAPSRLTVIVTTTCWPASNSPAAGDTSTQETVAAVH